MGSIQTEKRKRERESNRATRWEQVEEDSAKEVRVVIADALIRPNQIAERKSRGDRDQSERDRGRTAKVDRDAKRERQRKNSKSRQRCKARETEEEQQK